MFDLLCVCFLLHNAVLGYSPPGFSPNFKYSYFCDGDPIICICQLEKVKVKVA